MDFNFEYIFNYILGYNTGVPIIVICILFAIVCGFLVILFMANTNCEEFLRYASLCFLLGYVSFMLCATVLFREKADEFRYMLLPFWSYSVLYSRLWALIILNILLYIPIGFFAGGYLKKKSLITIFCIGCAHSVIIESIQLFSKRGVCSIDDVIHNTIGCLIGYGLFRLFYMMKPWLQCKLKTT